MDREITFHPKFTEWFESLKDYSAKAKISDRIDRALKGNLGVNKPVGQGVSEMVIDYGPGYRIYFGRKGNQLIVIIVGSVKKRSKKGNQSFSTNLGRNKEKFVKVKDMLRNHGGI